MILIASWALALASGLWFLSRAWRGLGPPLPKRYRIPLD